MDFAQLDCCLRCRYLWEHTVAHFTFLPSRFFFWFGGMMSLFWFISLCLVHTDQENNTKAVLLGYVFRREAGNRLTNKLAQ